MAEQSHWLRLYFAGNEPELCEIEFYHRLLSRSIHAIRGRNSVPCENKATFNWTSGVQSLALLFLRSVEHFLRYHGDGQSMFVLSGEAGTPASSLDYALARQSNWLLDIFGCDAGGCSLVRRFIVRRNPERKRGGPVVLSLNPGVLSPAAIQIFLGGKEIRDSASVGALATGLERRLRVQRRFPKTGSISEVDKPNVVACT